MDEEYRHRNKRARIQVYNHQRIAYRSIDDCHSDDDSQDDEDENWLIGAAEGRNNNDNNDNGQLDAFNFRQIGRVSPSPSTLLQHSNDVDTKDDYIGNRDNDDDVTSITSVLIRKHGGGDNGDYEDNIHDDNHNGDDTDDDDDDDASTVPYLPKAFRCSLTRDIMFDPVMDAQGNTFERAPLLAWLSAKEASPVSDEPLTVSMILPNIALRDVIHDYMGDDWVRRKSVVQSLLLSSLASRTTSLSPQRAKINSFLQHVTAKVGETVLKLNEQGCCAFRCNGITFVLDVPESVGVFCLYTRQLVPTLVDAMKDRILELNFLQGATRGGCLSTNTTRKDGSKKADPEVIFSYTDRVAEISYRDFNNILTNFIETAAFLRSELLASTTAVSTTAASNTATTTNTTTSLAATSLASTNSSSADTVRCSCCSVENCKNCN